MNAKDIQELNEILGISEVPCDMLEYPAVSVRRLLMSFHNWREYIPVYLTGKSLNCLDTREGLEAELR